MQTVVTIIVVAVSLLVLYGVVHIIRSTRKAKILGRKALPVSKENSKANKRILILGDSTAFGTGATNPNNSLAGRLSKDFPEASITNLSQNALNIDGLLKQITNISDKKFDTIMIHIGGIDTLTLTSFKKVRDRLIKIFDIAKKMATDNVILISMNNVGSAPAIKFPFSILYSNRSRKLRDHFTDICTECKIAHIPLFVEKKDDPLPQNPTKLYASDGIHPSDEGYGIWYEKIKSGILNHL